jgi:hypothetical protein
MADDTPVTFVNSVVQSGFANGIYNVAFSTARYVPIPHPETGKMVASIEEFISANLRMDLFCVQQLHDSLAQILAQQTKPATKPSEVN